MTADARSSPILHNLVDVHKGALQKAAVRGLLKVSGEIFRQVTGPQILAATPEIPERMGGQSENFENRRLGPDHAGVERRSPGTVPVELLPKFGPYSRLWVCQVLR